MVEWETSMGEKNDTFMDPSPQNLHYFKVVYEKYHLGWIKRWYSTGVDKLWSVSQIQYDTYFCIVPGAKNDLYFFEFF